MAVMTPIIHLITESDWAAARKAGSWSPPSLKTEGFIHCSRPEQVAATVKRHFPGRTDLLMLTLDPARITAEIREEDSYSRGETFPHIYGPLNLDAVIDVQPVPAA